ncbi:MAG: helix-turn-helix domain-containing protein, partial [Acetobacteraceae bacterium]
MGLTDIERAAPSGGCRTRDSGDMDDAGITWQPLYTVDDAAGIIGTRTRLYGELAGGRLDAVRVGRRTMITGASLRRWVGSLPRATFRGRRARQP